MGLKKKNARGASGFTFAAMKVNPNNWFSRAQAFKKAASLIARADEYSQPIPYYYNVGLSLELLLKAIAVAKGLDFDQNHRLGDLCDFVGIKVSIDQKCTLELLSELIVWGGRYPVPKKEGQWDNYHDVVQEKHKVREWDGKVGRVVADRKRFPTLDNNEAIWKIFEEEYIDATRAA